MRPVRLPQRQRGVALIIALILVALATILATKLSFDGYIERQRTVGVLAAEQALQFSFGAEALAADGLAQMPATQMTLADAWAQPVPPMPITPQSDPEGEPIGTVAGLLEDMQGRFNLNTLGRNLAGTAQPDPVPLAMFQRLLVNLGIEPKWGAMVRDWIDADETVSQDGAEDSVYSQQNPPYRTGNFPMLSGSELLNLPGFGADRYRKIAPYVTALPAADTKINICTAPAPVLESLADNLRGEFGTPEVLANARKQGCFPDQKTLQAIIGAKNWSSVQNYQDIKTNYFRLTTLVTLGTSEFTLYSLLANSGTGKYTPILRSFGTP